MKNPFTFQIESYLGAGFVLLFSLFCVGLILISVKNFSSDIEVMDAQQIGQGGIHTFSQTERFQMDTWMQENNVQFPDGEGYRWLERTYPSHPWR